MKAHLLQPKVFIWIGCLFLCLLLRTTAQGQCINFTGPSEVCAGVETYYSAGLNLGCCPVSACELGEYSWSISGGQIISTFNDYISAGGATVIWNEGGGTITVSHAMSPGLELSINVVAGRIPDDPLEIVTPGGSFVCGGGSIFLDSPGPQHPLQDYYWEYSTNNGLTWTSASITNESEYTFAPPGGSGSSTFVFRVRTIGSDPGCIIASEWRYSAPVSVFPAALNVSVSPAHHYCLNPTGAGLLVTLTSSNSDYDLLAININGAEAFYPKGRFSDADGDTIPVAPGSYNVAITEFRDSDDSRSPCTITNNGIVVSLFNPTVAVTINNVVNETCYNPGATTGSITASATGSALIKSYTWNHGVGPGATISNLAGDLTYIVTAIDANGCQGSNSAFVDEPDQISIASVPTVPTTCPNGGNGQVTINASGGTAPLMYSIDNGASFQAGNVFINLGVGPQHPVVRDANLCLQTFSQVSVGTPDPPTLGTVSITHPTCSGSGTGSITVNASGGAGALSYSIPGYAPQSVGVAINAIAPGTYTAITIIDASCGSYVFGDDVIINQPITATHSTSAASCNTVNDGSITVNPPSGGTGSYMYSLNYGAYATFSSTTTFTGLPPGSSYTISVRDGNLCTFQISGVNVALRPTITPGIVQTANILCNGDATASLDLTPGAGWTAPYTYLWRRNSVSTGLTTQDISGLIEGTYEATITDAVGCSTTSSAIVNQPSVLGASFSVPSTNGFAILCRNGTTGSINLTPTGGTPGGGPAYSFLWYRNEVSTGITTEDLAGLNAGNYRVRITDGNGCQLNTTNQILNEPTNSVSASITGEEDISCFGSNNGEVEASGVAGFGALDYRIDGTGYSAGYQVSNTFIGLPPNTYTVTVIDDNNCTASSSPVVITQPAAALTFSSIVPVNPACAGASTGSFTLGAQGGTSPYEFSVNGTNFFSATIPNLSASTYAIIAEDANGCQVTQTNQVLTNPTAIIFSSVTPQSQSCAAVVDGRIVVAASGGTGVLQFSLNGTDYQTNTTFESLTTGSYTVRARDGNSCLVTSPANVGIVPAITPTIGQTASVSCFGFSNAALTVNTIGGSGVFSYAWSNSAVTQNISGLPAGSYDVEVTDDKGCSGTDDFTVTQPAALGLSFTPSNYSGFGVTCPAATDGFINLTVTGGTAPFGYNWSNTAVIKDISSLAADNYSVTVTDANSCQINSGVTLVAPTPVLISESSKSDVSCHGGNTGAVTVASSGGAGGYEFSIDNGSHWQTPSTFSLLVAGGYNVLVRDDNSCTNQVAVTIAQPTLMGINLSNIVQTTCGNSNGSADVASTGGTGSHTYEWKNASSTVIGTATSITSLGAGIYTVTVTDQALCEMDEQLVINSSDGTDFLVTSIVATSCSYSEDGEAEVQIVDGNGPYTIVWVGNITGTSASHLPPGDNVVSVMDADGCNTFQSFQMPSPDPLAIVSQVITPPVCPGEANASIEIQLSGGTGVYGYGWNNVSGTNLLEDVAPGDYSLHITDQNDCELNTTITVIDLDEIEISLVSESVPTCHASTDGIITVNATGANDDFSYLWTTEGVSNSQLSGVGEGSYNVLVTDDRGCTANASFTLTAPSVVSISVDTTQPASCNGSSDGALTLQAAGGAGTYSYSIDNGAVFQTSATFEDLAAQTLTLIAKDINGCSASSSGVTITQPDVISVSSMDILNTTCGQSNGQATAIATGGNGTYTYAWFNTLNVNVSSGISLNNAPSGQYTILVQDQLHCEGSTTLTILPSAASEITVKSIQQTDCIDSADGRAEVEVVSGPGPHSFLWSSNETTFAAIQLIAGSNTVSVTDANNCVTTETFIVPAPTAISLANESVTQPTCPGTATGLIQVLASGGGGGYTYRWNNVVGTNTLQNLSSGVYQLEVTDAKACVFTKAIVVPDVPVIEILLANVINPTCFGGGNGSLTVGAQGGNGSFSFLWQNGTTGTFVNNLQAGTYSVEATDIKGCKSASSFDVNNPPPVVINIGEDRTICPGQAATVNPQIPASSYAWTGPSGFINSNQQISVSTPGTYTLRIIDLDGCVAEDKFILSVSDQLLHADLIMAAEAHAMDTIMVIDISWPIPETVNWEFDEAVVIQSTSDFAMIQYEEPGTYTVTINASLGGCESTFSQVVRILEQRDPENGRGNSDEPLRFVSYTAYPNPFREQLDVEVTFNKISPLTMQLVNVSMNKVVFETLLPDDFEHRKSFLTGNIVPGLYVLLLKAGDEIKSIRLLRL
jgi:uncharacterized protein (DUF2141 family)